MALPDLLDPTGILKIDNILKGFIGLCELTFPERISSYYLGGSYSDGHAIDTGPTNNSSDLDLFAIFKEEIKPEEEEKFNEVVLCCRQFGTIGLDAHPTAETQLLDTDSPNVLNTLIKIASLHLYGRDIRSEIPQLTFPHYVQQVIDHGLFHSGQTRQTQRPITFPLKDPMVYPVTVPDPSKPLLGYDMPVRYPDGTQGPPGTRLLIAIVLWAATLGLVLKSGRYTGTKFQSVKLYRELLNDEWTPLVEGIFYKCKKEWGHEIPPGEAEKAQLREWSWQTPALENHFLELARNFMLEQLRAGDKADKIGALMGFQSVVYPGDTELLVAVLALQTDPDKDIAETAATTLKVMTEAR
jgi:hypothetical protein